MRASEKKPPGEGGMEGGRSQVGRQVAGVQRNREGTEEGLGTGNVTDSAG